MARLDSPGALRCSCSCYSIQTCCAGGLTASCEGRIQKPFILHVIFLQQQCQQSDGASEALPAHIELLGSFNNLITAVEQLQSSFLLSPDAFGDGELATPPRKVLHTLR